MSIYPCVRWQGKSINEQNSVYESSYTDFGVPKKVLKQDEIAVENNQENHFDIATAWGTPSYRQAGQTYADTANAASKN